MLRILPAVAVTLKNAVLTLGPVKSLGFFANSNPRTSIAKQANNHYSKMLSHVLSLKASKPKETTKELRLQPLPKKQKSDRQTR